MNSLVIELAKMNAKERALVEQCKDFLGMIAAMQVKIYSNNVLWFFFFAGLSY